MHTLAFARRSIAGFAGASAVALFASTSAAATLSNELFTVETGNHGEIQSLRLTGDLFPTNYVLNAENAPSQNTSDHQWLGELMFTYRMGSGQWVEAWSNRSADARTVSEDGNTITVTYANASDPGGIRNFEVVETYALIDDYLSWQVKITNTSGSNLEIGDFGLPLAFNEYWFAPNDRIYETRVLPHTFTGYEGSYITIQRPSGMGPYLLLVPDDSTGAGFEYQDHWTELEHPGSAWAQGGGSPVSWPGGLNVLYVHSEVIKSTNQGYLENSSLHLAAGEAKTYGFKFFKVESEADVKSRLYSEGLVDVTVVPGMIVSQDMTAKMALRTQKTIRSVTPQHSSDTTLQDLGVSADGHHIYSVQFSRLGENHVTVEYGTEERTVLQFWVMEPIADALQRHATFMVEKTQVSDGAKFYDGAFDDWMMDHRELRDAFGGYMGWGDDWGYTHAQFLAEKNVQTPVASEVAAIDAYLETTIEGPVMGDDFRIHNWLNSPAYNDDETRGYAYPHVYNTYFAMYRVAKFYPDLIDYHLSASDYLFYSFRILDALYGRDVNYNYETGLMGEHTTPDIIAALREEGFDTEATRVEAIMDEKFRNFSATTYPYGSEYTYDNTGEEAVYTLARMNSNTEMMGKINLKTRACRGQQPAWYYYSDPTTLNGEGWWQFQYTVALAGSCMDDWVRRHSSNPEVEQRLTYAAKLGNLSAINSGQIDPDPANIGSVSWTYQAQKGNLYKASAELYPTGTLGEARIDPATLSLHGGGWRSMAGEADLGLWGAIRILSSDVAVDPIFGVYCYGCDVSDNGTSYTVVPRDGVQQKLNLITEKLYVSMTRDQYTRATVSKVRDSVELTVNNLAGSPHELPIVLEGMAAGTHDLVVDGAMVGSVTVSDSGTTVATVPLGAEVSSVIRIGAEAQDCDIDCDDNDPCTTDACDGPTGTCSHEPMPECCQGDGDCVDTDACTTDLCNPTTLRCEHVASPDCCTTDSTCLDTDPCTQDVCDPTTRQCTHLPDPACDGETPSTNGGSSDGGSSDQDKGCGCRAAGGGPASGGLLLLAVVATLGLRSKRRRWTQSHGADRRR